MVDTRRSELAVRLGGNLTHWRKALGLTQGQVALRLAVEPETISRFERGMTLPSLPTLARLAEVLGATMAQLLEEESPPPFDGIDKLASRLEPLSEQDRKFVMDVMTRLCAHCSEQTKSKRRRTANPKR
ncbi:MAG: helix-turn-helix transcriptional regulator [Gallionella sp.]|jgi:transcriptional regulator with XRE-family HTH domain